MTIRLRLALLFTTAMVILLLGGGYLFLHRLQSGLETTLDTTLTARSDALNSELGQLSASATSALPRQSKLGDANGVFAQLLTATGQLLESSDNLADAPLITPAEAAAAARRTIVADITVTIHAVGDKGPESMRVLARATGNQRAVLAVAISRDVVDQAVHRSTLQLLVLGIIVLMLTGPGAWLVTRSALRPVEQMRREAGELGAGDVAAVLAVPPTHDEIARLAQTFNSLLDRLHAAVARERAFVADAGHELRTPLTVLKGELELARRPGRRREELVNTIEIAAEETERLAVLTEELLVLASDADAPHLRCQQFDLTALVAVAVHAAATVANPLGIDVVMTTADPVQTTGDPDRIRQAVDNLLSNAVRHSPASSAVSVTISSPGNQVQVIVHDQGEGFPPDFIPVAFERFTRADGMRGRSGPDPGGLGLGLGLAIVASVMAIHDGTATAANDPNGGATLTLSWPRFRTAAVLS